MSAYDDFLSGLEAQYKLPSGYLRTVRQIESGGGRNTTPGASHQGDFQFDKATAASVGLVDRNDPHAAAIGAAKLGAQRRDYLSAHLGIAPEAVTPDMIYLAHQQGHAGAVNLLAHPGTRVGDLVGDAAVKGNGGNPDVTAGEYSNLWRNKYNKFSGVSTGSTPGIGSDYAMSMHGSAAHRGLLGDLLGPPGGTAATTAAPQEQPAPTTSKYDDLAALVKQATAAPGPSPMLQQTQQIGQGLLAADDAEQSQRMTASQQLMATLLPKVLKR